ncbi:MAG: o-succinylbenzoate synthase [Gemmatimonadaceae bacterium]|nr:o-succinylbenzoate synthase [Gemmatimonadaceae bacterium]
MTAPLHLASLTLREIHLLLLALTDVDGVTTWSECVAGEWPNYSAETIDTAWLALTQWLAPRLLGRPVPRAADVRARLDENIRGHPMAKAALEMGCWALEATRAGTALSVHLGGTRDQVEAGVSMGIQASPAILAEKMIAARDAGYARLKCKIAPGFDVAYLAAAREAVGPAPRMSVDANAAYTLDDTDTLLALDAFGLLYIEQPLAQDDLVRHAALQARLHTAICLDESILDEARTDDMHTLGSGRVINIKPGRVGGFTVSKAIHDRCLARGTAVWCGGMLESGIGRAYNVALASLPGFTLPGDLSPSARYWTEDIVTPEWTMGPQGLVRVPRDAPGLGVEPRIDRIDALTVRHETLRAP